MPPMLSRKTGVALFIAGVLLALFSPILEILSCTNLAGRSCPGEWDEALVAMAFGFGLIVVGILAQWAQRPPQK